DRRGNVFAPVGRRAGPRDEAVTLLDVAAVAVERARDARVQPLRGFVGAAQVQHQNDSSAAFTTICGFTFMSGCTPIMRSVCCTVALNTGAATSPPKYLPAEGSSTITA